MERPFFVIQKAKEWHTHGRDSPRHKYRRGGGGAGFNSLPKWLEGVPESHSDTEQQVDVNVNLVFKSKP